MCDGVSTRRALCGVSSTEQAGVQQVKSGSWFYGKTLAVAGRLIAWTNTVATAKRKAEKFRAWRSPSFR